MKQVECPDCGAPMWEGGRCPWATAEGCGRRLTIVKAQPIREPRPEPVRKVVVQKVRKVRVPKPPKPPRIKREPVVRPLRSVICGACSTEFETQHKTKAYCNSRCRIKADNRRKYAVRRKPRTRRIGKAPATCHPERLMAAHGLCRPCYQRQWDHAKNTRGQAAAA